MKSMKSLFFAAMLCTLSVSPLAFAGEGTAGDYAADMGIQFGRGLMNVVSSPAEIPCTMRDDIQEKGGGVGTFTGFSKGLAFFVRRAVVGVCEVGTFFMPAPKVLPTVCAKPVQAQTTGVAA